MNKYLLLSLLISIPTITFTSYKSPSISISISHDFSSDKSYTVEELTIHFLDQGYNQKDAIHKAHDVVTKEPNFIFESNGSTNCKRPSIKSITPTNASSRITTPTQYLATPASAVLIPAIFDMPALHLDSKSPVAYAEDISSLTETENDHK